MKNSVLTKNKVAVLTLTFALLLSVVAASELANPVNANPYLKEIKEDYSIPAPEGTEPLIIFITSPENHTTIPSSNFPLIFNRTTIDRDFFWFSQMHYKASWQKDITYLDQGHVLGYINLTDVPEGNHSIQVFANERYTAYKTRERWEHFSETAKDGTVYSGDVFVTYYASYRRTGNSTVYFTVDLPPKISILTLDNKTYTTANVTLDFTANEPTSKIAYSLDGTQNVTITGNTTLTGLPNGMHNVTLYAWDSNGNAGASETRHFNVDVPEPFPATTVIVLFALSAVVASVGLKIYFKKNHHPKTT